MGEVQLKKKKVINIWGFCFCFFFFADSPDVIFSDRSRKGKKFYKDSEKVPLGDHDELSMI